MILRSILCFSSALQRRARMLLCYTVQPCYTIILAGHLRVLHAESPLN